MEKISKISKKGLYVHIPFCNQICTYCNFSKVLYDKKFVSKYLKCLKKELKKYNKYTFTSIYIGGGTPSCLSIDELDELFSMLIPYQQEDSFITIEVNPDMELEKVDVFKKYNVKRVSIGVQTFNREILEQINRNSRFYIVNNLIKRLRKAKIKDISLDLMYGFNNQTTYMIMEDIEKFVFLPIKHISTYCLQIEDNTILKNNNYEEEDDDNVADDYDFIVKYLKKKKFNRYEVSNFCKKGYESKHNLIYWNNDEYGGVGLGASSYIDKVRRTNTKSLTLYLKGKYKDYEEVLSIEDEEYYFIMLGLRKTNGISLKDYYDKFHQDFFEKYYDKISIDILNGDLLVENDHLKLNEKNFFILDHYLRKILY